MYAENERREAGNKQSEGKTQGESEESAASSIERIFPNKRLLGGTGKSSVYSIRQALVFSCRKRILFHRTAKYK